MVSDEEKKQYNKGVVKGALISGLITFAVVALSAGIIISLYIQHNEKQKLPALNLSESTTNKVNLLLSYIDHYFLYDYDEEDISEELYDAVMAALDDPYSCYYTAEEYKSMMDSSKGVYFGIGVVVMTEEETGLLKVVEPYEGAPGDIAGIEVDDYILAVDGTDITEMDSSTAVTLIRGEDGTTVTLTLQRNDETFDVDVVRGSVDIVTVESEMLDNNIGYIAVSEFDEITITQFESAINELIDEGMEGLIIDIRSNPGGRLDAVVSMLDLILPEGIVVYTEDKNGDGQKFTSDAETVLDVPCAVLINGNSASASEIFAGAMQDYDMAEIIGEQSFGKGIVQSIFPLTDGSSIKITVQNYFTPNGNNIHGLGITPDTIVEFDGDAYTADGTDNQLDAAIEYIMDKME